VISVLVLPKVDESVPFCGNKNTVTEYRPMKLTKSLSVNPLLPHSRV